MRLPPHRFHRLWVLGAILGLGGCAGGIDIPGGTLSSPTSTTAGASVPGDVRWPAVEAESFPVDVERAATRVVGAYLEMTDRITGLGGGDSTPMSALTTSTWFPTEQRGFDHYVAEGLRTTGTTRFHSLVVQSVWRPGPEGLAIDVVACVDATNVWLVPLEAPDPPEGLIEWVGSDSLFFEGEDDQWEEWNTYLDTYLPTPGVVEAVVFWLVGPTLDDLRLDGTANWEGVHSCREPISE